jgi:tetratricopeptide (TPR) repeat protein
LGNSDTTIDEEQLRNEILETHLLVIFVTSDMLQSVTLEELPVEYSIAKELNIPILPILKDDGLFNIYNEKLEPSHCIAKSDSEYRVKLKAQMDMLLASEEIIALIKEKAFTMTVFASYRKEEISEVRRFMKAFHDLEGFEQISVLYDNFLTAGRDFHKDIKELIKKSDALVLVVTPALATEGNYVQRLEYPFAQEIGKLVVPVEAVPTYHEQFYNLYPGAGCPIPLDDTNALQEAFRKTLDVSAFANQLDSERAYLLGMAYLKMINVERDFDRAVRLLEVAAEDYTMASINAANQLASIYENGTGINIDFDKALLWYQKTLVIQEKMLGNGHPDTTVTYNNIASIYENKGDYAKALEWCMNNLRICEKIFGKEHLNTASAYNNIALIYSRQGDYDKALKLYQKALAVYEKERGRDHSYTAATYNNIALIYFHMGEYDQALEWHQKDLEICEKFLGKEHPDTATAYNNIARVYEKQGNFTKALEWYQEALEICQKAFGEHPYTATAYNNIAELYSHLEDYKNASEWHQRALEIREKVLGKKHPYTATSYNNIGLVCHYQGNYDQALEWYQKALEIRERVLGKKHPDTGIVYNNIAGVYDSQGDYDKALEWYQNDLEICEKVFGKEHTDTATTYNNIAGVYENQGDYNKALEWYQKALVIYEKIFGKDHPDTVAVYNNIAGVYDSQQKYLKAPE